MTNKEYPEFDLYRRIVKAKLFIDANYASGIDINNISGEAAFSKFHFIRIFKKIYRKTPHQYLIHVQIDNAVLLLRKGMSVSDVCVAVGFESLSSFSVLFKKIKRQSPSAFQHQQQKRKEQIASAPLHFIPSCYAGRFGLIK